MSDQYEQRVINEAKVIVFDHLKGEPLQTGDLDALAEAVTAYNTDRGTFTPVAPAPVHQHDGCADCRHIGHLLGRDVWICPQGGMSSTLIARGSDAGPDYSSGPYLYIDHGSGVLRLEGMTGREDLDAIIEELG